MERLVLERTRVEALFTRLLDTYGPQHWWPADTPFEMMVGAVLTQNTRWQNVEKALERLRAAEMLNVHIMAALPLDVLAEHLRPVGYYNLKARRLSAFTNWYRDSGGFETLSDLETGRLREALLNVSGIGPETADDILLYAFYRPVFVIDAYTRRLFGRLGLLPAAASYEQLRAAFEASLSPDAGRYGEYHALIVAHAKHVCRPRPDCSACCLRGECRLGRG